MSATIPQDFTGRIDAEIRAHGRAPATDEQIAATLASVAAAFRGVSAASAIPRTDPIQEARDRIRAAMRDLHALNVTLNASACDDDFDQPNRATDALAELTLALECLKELGGAR